MCKHCYPDGLLRALESSALPAGVVRLRRQLALAGISSGRRYFAPGGPGWARRSEVNVIQTHRHGRRSGGSRKFRPHCYRLGTHQFRGRCGGLRALALPFGSEGECRAEGPAPQTGQRQVGARARSRLTHPLAPRGPTAGTERRCRIGKSHLLIGIGTARSRSGRRCETNCGILGGDSIIRTAQR